MPDVQIIVGHCLDSLRAMADDSVQCCVTSPPYFGLRDYGCAGQIGLEATPAEFVAALVAVFEEVRRVLKSDGTLWLNLGDSYANDGKWGGHTGGKHAKALHCSPIGRNKRYTGLKAKDLIGIPWRVAFALQAAGWYLRSDIIWHKPNPMPESVTDRPTRAHEYIFLLSKSPSYYYDHEAIKEEGVSGKDGHGGTVARKSRQQEGNKSFPTDMRNGMRPDKQRGHSRRHNGFNNRWDTMTVEEQTSVMRNKRDVWVIPPANYADAHFATFPPDLIKPCIMAGTKPGDMVLDPFGGSGTTGMVALELGRSAILCELNPSYAQLARDRCNITVGLPLQGVA